MCSAGNQPKQQKRGLDRFHQNQMDEMMTWGFFTVITYSKKNRIRCQNGM